MPPADHDDPADAILAFLAGIGIQAVPAELGEDTFLPGIELGSGRLRVDRTRLAYPGDLLHEGGHIAVAPPSARPALTGTVDVPGLDMERLEMTVVPWSYAAALTIGIEPAVVFHEGGYRGRSEGILRTYGFGVYPGVSLLEEAGMCATGARAAELGVSPYPHMLRWLRE